MTEPREPTTSEALLVRTQGAVLNVLLASSVGIGASGVWMRLHDAPGAFATSPKVRQILLGGLLVVFVGSYVGRRLATGTPAWFFRGRVIAAVLAALAVPLGLAHGLLVRPDLREIAPFWVTALVLGFLAYPRRNEPIVVANFEDEPPR